MIKENIVDINNIPTYSCARFKYRGFWISFSQILHTDKLDIVICNDENDIIKAGFSDVEDAVDYIEWMIGE